MKTCFMAIFVAIAVTMAFLVMFPQKETESLLSNNAKGLFDLEAHWKLGNVVALIRHAERCDRSETECFDGKDGITVLGVEEAIEVGSAYNNLLEHPAIIYNSPVKRTDQTAEFMFGEKSSDQKWLRDGCKDNLLNDIFDKKEDGKNLILITHSTCIDALGEKEGKKIIELEIHEEETYSASFFLAIDKEEQRIHVLGYMFAEDWGIAYK